MAFQIQNIHYYALKIISLIRCKFYIIVCTFTFCIISNQPYAQFVDPKVGKDFFNNKNYIAAISVYERLLLKDKGNPEYNHYLGICYLNSNINKRLAIPYLEKAIRDPKAKPDVLFDLALAYHYSDDFAKALDLYSKYKLNGKGPKQDLVDRKIEMCENGKLLSKASEFVSFENLGPSINSKFPDYYPFVAKDESYIVFTSRRGGVLEFDGFYQSDIYISENTTGTFGSSKNGGATINSDFDDQAVGLSNDADKLFIYLDNIKEYGDIYTADRDGKRFGKMVKLGENVNSNDFETSASISADGNTLFFTSIRPEGQGALDLYMSRKLPMGDWGLPQNLGSQVNTKYNEDFPTLSEDGQTLYFCSEGHNSIGGYDIFTSQWESESNSWSKPKNIGYPVNNGMDNRTISFSESGKTAYISALRKEGLGDLDIYRVKFPVNIIIQLQLPTKDPDNPIIKDAYVQLNNPLLKRSYTFKANKNTGFYTIILNRRGTFTLKIEAEGYELHTEELDLRHTKDNDINFKFVNLIPNN